MILISVVSFPPTNIAPILLVSQKCLGYSSKLMPSYLVALVAIVSDSFNHSIIQT